MEIIRISNGIAEAPQKLVFDVPDFRVTAAMNKPLITKWLRERRVYSQQHDFFQAPVWEKWRYLPADGEDPLMLTMWDGTMRFVLRPVAFYHRVQVRHMTDYEELERGLKPKKPPPPKGPRSGVSISRHLK